MQKMELTRIARQYSITLTERRTPDEAELAAVVGNRLTAILESRLRAQTSLERERGQRFLPMARLLAEDADTLPLLAMLLDGIYQANRHPVLPGSPVDKVARRKTAQDEAPPAGEAKGRRRRGRRPRTKGDSQGNQQGNQP
jgi:ATP-dependent RNA helicase DeaD